MCNGCEMESEKRKTIVKDLKQRGQDSILTEVTDILHNLSLTIGKVCDPGLAEEATVGYEDLVDAIHDFGEKTVKTFEESFDLIVGELLETFGELLETH